MYKVIVIHHCIHSWRFFILTNPYGIKNNCVNGHSFEMGEFIKVRILRLNIMEILHYKHKCTAVV